MSQREAANEAPSRGLLRPSSTTVVNSLAARPDGTGDAGDHPREEADGCAQWCCRKSSVLPPLQGQFKVYLWSAHGATISTLMVQYGCYFAIVGVLSFWYKPDANAAEEDYMSASDSRWVTVPLLLFAVFNWLVFRDELSDDSECKANWRVAVFIGCTFVGTCVCYLHNINAHVASDLLKDLREVSERHGATNVTLYIEEVTLIALLNARITTEGQLSDIDVKDILLFVGYHFDEIVLVAFLVLFALPMQLGPHYTYLSVAGAQVLGGLLAGVRQRATFFLFQFMLVQVLYFTHRKIFQDNDRDSEEAYLRFKETVMLFRSQQIPRVVPELLQLRTGRKLGAGGSGQIYKGVYSGIPVAIKELYTTKISPDDLKELRAESAVMSTLRHPHVLEFYGICEMGNRTMLVSELCTVDFEALLHAPESIEGAPLPLLLEWLSPAVKLGAVAQLTSALRYLKSKDMVHHDLKPANILLSKLPKHPRDTAVVKLCDFGLARAVATKRYAVGDTVMADVGGGDWHRVIIAEVNADGTFDMECTVTNRMAKAVPASRVRPKHYRPDDINSSSIPVWDCAVDAKSGTVRYCPPEVLDVMRRKEAAAAPQGVDPYAWDVYALGIVLCEFVTGRSCPGSATEMPNKQVQVAVVENGARPDIRAEELVAAGFVEADALVALIRSCWEQDPAARPDLKSVGGEVERLAELQSEGGAEVREPTPLLGPSVEGVEAKV